MALLGGTLNQIIKQVQNPTGSYRPPGTPLPQYSPYGGTPNSAPINPQEAALTTAAIKYNNANPNPAGAAGVYQFMKEGRGYSPSKGKPAPKKGGGGGGGGGGGRGGVRYVRRGGGGGRRGGGGGGGGAAAGAQSQLDYMLQLLGSKGYTAQPMTAARESVGKATQADLASANTAWGNLDTWLGQNQQNPYANMQMGQAPTSPSYNPYLESQGVQALNGVYQNPEDSYGGFQNVLKLLSGGWDQQAQSQRAASQMGRAASTTGINAMDNGFLAAISNKEAAAQQALDAEKRAAAMQIAPLLAQGAKAPADFLARMGMA